MKQVLIVDDESRLLKSIKAGFHHYRDTFTVNTAENGRKAVEILNLEEIDLLVTDLRMPEMDGFELLAYVSATAPFMPTIIMTAFATPEIEERLNSTGYMKLLEKPIDIERLADAIIDGLEQEGKEGSVAGFSLASFLQLLAMEKKTCLLNVEFSNSKGYLYLDDGELFAAITGDHKDEEAVYRMLAHENVRITFKKLPKRKVKKTIHQPLMSLLMEGMQRKDEGIEERDDGTDSIDGENVIPAGSELTNEPLVDLAEIENVSGEEISLDGERDDQANKLIQGEQEMGQLEETLGKLSDVEGFMAVGIFTPNGEMAAQVNSSGIKLAEIGSIANDVLLKAQKATDVMDVGRGHVVHIEAPQAHVIARCLNENEDFSTSTAGKAHLHMILLLKKEGNLAMAKIKMESIISEAASAFR